MQGRDRADFDIALRPLATIQTSQKDEGHAEG